MPVQRGDGSLYGTLCGVDREPHEHSEAEIAALTVLARLVASQIDGEERARLEGALLAARTAAHEVNNRLMGVTVPLSPLVGDERLPGDARERAQQALESALDAAAVLNRLRAISRIERSDWGPGAPPTIDIERSIS